jgi:large subunit ribosomal protein L6
MRKLVANMVEGVGKGFSRVLEINGVGYRAEAKGQQVNLTLGYSHPIVYQLPPGVTAKVEKQVTVTLESADRQLLGTVAAQIRELRPPEPYKGKGIKYATETIRRKAGKAAAGSTSA